MKRISLLLALALSVPAFAQVKTFAGSDTLAGAISDAIVQAGLESQIQYIGGGSGNGEKGLIAGDQTIAPLSRPIKPDVKTQLEAKSGEVREVPLALDGLSLFVKTENGLRALDLPTVVRIFTCEFTQWSQVQAGMTGAIRAYRRNDASGTTDAFKHFTGIKTFGACVQVLPETADIADATSREINAIGYSGLSGDVAGNRPVPLAKAAGGTPVLPTTATIRNFSYPMARTVYVYEVLGIAEQAEGEAALMTYISDRSFMDPIMQAHEFITID